MGCVQLLHTAQLLKQTGDQHPPFVFHDDFHTVLAFYHTENPALLRYNARHKGLWPNLMLKLQTTPASLFPLES